MKPWAKMAWAIVLPVFGTISTGVFESCGHETATKMGVFVTIPSVLLAIVILAKVLWYD